MAASPNLSTALARYLADHPTGEIFPNRDTDYSERFQRLDEWLNKYVHAHVNQGATAGGPDVRSTQPLNRPVWLTDHGPDHVTAVIRRAGALAIGRSPILTPYEAYLLLLAIHFHDVGNVFGREGHEKKIADVMTKIDRSLLGDDSLEKRMVRDIAMVHGGEIDGDKDTISRLPYERGSKENEPRVHLLAALLRIADELAEDSSRTSRFLLETNLISPESEVYHIYADRLQRVEIDPRSGTVSLRFDINTETGLRTYQKKGEHVFLFDEIQSRLLKLHNELVYCGRYLRPYVHIDSIDVKIDICTSDYMEVLDSQVFSIRESGYPGGPANLADVCPELVGQNGKSMRERIQTLLARAS